MQGLGSDRADHYGTQTSISVIDFTLDSDTLLNMHMSVRTGYERATIFIALLRTHARTRI